MRRIGIAGLLAAVFMAGCSDATSVDQPDPAGAGNLEIVLAKGVWQWNEVDRSGSGLAATLRNTSGRTFQSRMGDAFNSAPEQPQLFIANGGDGAVERRHADGTWGPAPVTVLVEGVKSVTLRGGGTYTVRAILSGSPQPGTYRIRVDYREGTGNSVSADYSRPFEIR